MVRDSRILVVCCLFALPGTVTARGPGTGSDDAGDPWQWSGTRGTEEARNAGTPRVAEPWPAPIRDLSPAWIARGESAEDLLAYIERINMVLAEEIRRLREDHDELRNRVDTELRAELAEVRTRIERLEALDAADRAVRHVPDAPPTGIALDAGRSDREDPSPTPAAAGPSGPSRRGRLPRLPEWLTRILGIPGSDRSMKRTGEGRSVGSPVPGRLEAVLGHPADGTAHPDGSASGGSRDEPARRTGGDPALRRPVFSSEGRWILESLRQKRARERLPGREG